MFYSSRFLYSRISMIRDADIFYIPIFLYFYISIKHFYDGGILQIHGGNELIN